MLGSKHNKYMKIIIIILVIFFIVTKSNAGFFSDIVENPKEFFSDVAESLDEGINNSAIFLHKEGLISYKFVRTTNKPINRAFGIKFGSVFEKAKPSKIEWLGKEISTEFQPMNAISFLSKFEVFVDENKKVYKILAQSNPAKGRKDCEMQIKKFVDIVEQKYEVIFYSSRMSFMGQDSMALISNVHNSGVITVKCDTTTQTDDYTKDRQKDYINWNLYVEYNNKSIESNFDKYLRGLKLQELKIENRDNKKRKNKYNKYDV